MTYLSENWNNWQTGAYEKQTGEYESNILIFWCIYLSELALAPIKRAVCSGFGTMSQILIMRQWVTHSPLVHIIQLHKMENIKSKTGFSADVKTGNHFYMNINIKSEESFSKLHLGFSVSIFSNTVKASNVQASFCLISQRKNFKCGK